MRNWQKSLSVSCVSSVFRYDVKACSLARLNEMYVSNLRLVFALFMHLCDVTVPGTTSSVAVARQLML